MDKVFIIGAGRMGYGVTKTLIRKGYEVTVYDPALEARKRAKSLGANVVDDVNDAISDHRFILLSLPGPKEVKETVQNIGNNAKTQTFVIDLSTIDPKTAMEMSETCKPNGISYIEAPVSGGPIGAETGTLSIMVGATKDDYERVEALFRDIGKNIYHIGDVGSASIVKICNNIVVAATTAILSEAFLLASSGGVDPAKLKEILSNSVASSKTLDLFGHHIVTGDYSNPTFALKLMHKDVGLFNEAMKQFGLTSLVGTLTSQIYNSANNQGLSDEDHTAICKFIEQINNRHINREIHAS